MLSQIVLILEEMLATSAIRSMLRYVFDTCVYYKQMVEQDGVYSEYLLCMTCNKQTLPLSGIIKKEIGVWYVIWGLVLECKQNLANILRDCASSGILI